MKKILIIEDDKVISKEIADTLKFFEYKTHIAVDGIDGIKLYKKIKPELIILDIMLPCIDGFEVLKRIRAFDANVPVLMLTAKSSESDKLLGFELGVDDYIVKPFSLKELVARIKVALKRSSTGLNSQDLETAIIGSTHINFKDFIVRKGKEEYQLSPKENKILKLFVNNPNAVINRDKIIDEVWGDDYYPSPRTIDNFILKLRSIIENEPKKPEFFITVHGAGYKLVI
jgi:DNA-binding response OmpR family regulator